MSRIDEALRRAQEKAGDGAGGQAAAEPDLHLYAPAAPDSAWDPEIEPEPDVDEVAVEPELERPSALQTVETERDTRATVPAEMPRVPLIVNEKLVSGSAMTSIATEQYRRVAAVLHQVQQDRGIKTVLVASATAGEGKSLTAANLALTLSESLHRSVLLVDADLRRPTLHRIFQLANGPGLTEGLSAEHDMKLPITATSPRLSVLPAGRPDPDPMGMLASPRMRRVIEEASAKFDWVIIDTPPVALLPDANLLAQFVDAVVFVISAGTTPFYMIERAVKALDRNRIVGVVLNRALEPQSMYQYYRHYASLDSDRNRTC
jgi:capsular exopolysaccharide synthesis family protein